jgi:uncharacterized protein (DUF169 family)
MDLRIVQQAIGGRWAGIEFHEGEVPQKNLAKRPMRLCEAIKESVTAPVTLTYDLIDCDGALRSLGWNANGDHEIANKVSNATGAKLDIVAEVVKNTPRLNDGISAVTIGACESPDLVVSYAQPVIAMNLVRRWQLSHGFDLKIAASSVMSVCGNVVARAYNTGRICLSFGCPDSRKHGAIGRDRLVIGMPVSSITDLFSTKLKL